jgi:hypothetical protein
MICFLFTLFFSHLPTAMPRESLFRQVTLGTYARMRRVLRPREKTFVMRSEDGRTRYVFQQTTGCCPQQWEAKIGNSDSSVLYVRMRGGNFSAMYMVEGSDGPHEQNFLILDDDLWITENFEPYEFETEEQRDKHIRRAIAACERWRANERAGVTNTALPHRFRMPQVQ